MLNVRKWITQVNEKLRTMIIKDPDFPTSTPTANYYTNDTNPATTFAITDENDSQVMYAQAYYRINGERGMEVGSRKTVNGSTTQNYVALAFDSNDEPVVKVADADAWLSALGLAVTTGTITYASGWKAYASSQPLTLKKQGNVVTLIGAFSPSATTATIATTAITVATIPAGYRPPVRTVALIQGSGSDIAAASVDVNGNIQIERLRAMNSTSYKAATSGNWFPVNMSWIVN